MAKNGVALTSKERKGGELQKRKKYMGIYSNFGFVLNLISHNLYIYDSSLI